MRMQHKLVAALAAGTVGIGAAVAGVAGATTGPAPHTLVNVVITDSSIRLSKSHVHDVTYVDFYLHNTGKLSHDFIVGTSKSVVVKPGGRVHFYAGFPVRLVSLPRRPEWEAADEGALPHRLAGTA